MERHGKAPRRHWKSTESIRSAKNLMLIHPSKILPSKRKMEHLKMYFLLTLVIFQSDVSSQEGNSIFDSKHSALWLCMFPKKV